jgi:2'-5' RNA ligase
MTDHPTAAPRWRLFVAAPVPVVAAQQLWTVLGPILRRHPGSRWARLEQLHATVVFLGQTTATRVPRIEQAMAAAATRHAPFEVATADAGGRVDDRRGGVAWLRIDEGARELRELSVEVDRLIGSNLYAGGAPRPHITVARQIDEALLVDLRSHAADLRTRWLVDRIVLYRSHPDLGGSRYEQLAERLLTGAPGST